MSIMPGPEPDSLFAVVNEPPATPRKRPRRVNSTVPIQDRAKKQGTQDLIREMLLDGKRFNYLDVMRLTGSPSTAQRINELCDQGMPIKRDKSAVGNGIVDYWMLPEDIAAWKASEVQA